MVSIEAEMTKLPSAFLAAGWDPTQPSADCVAETAPRLTPNSLSDEDRRGVHWVLLTVDLCRRFYPHFKKENREEDMQAVECAATLHMLRVAGLPREKSSFHAALAAVRAWKRDVLDPAYARMKEARKRDLSDEQLSIARESFEPAWTLEASRNARGWIDFDGNIRAVQKALRLVERRGVLRAEDASAPDASDEVVTWVLEKAKPGAALAWVSSSGQIRLGRRELRDVLESLAGKVEPVKKNRSESEDHALLCTSLASDAPSPSDIAAVSDLLEVVKVWAASRAMRASGDPHAIAVLEHFQPLLTKKTPVRALAASRGLDPESVRRSLIRLRDEFRSTQVLV